MTHPTQELTALLDGALAPGERAEVERHLAGCAACCAERDRLAAGIAALARLPAPPEPSPGFEQRFHARLARERAATGRGGWLRRVRWGWLAPGLAGATAMAMAAVWVSGRHRAEEAFMAEHLDLFESYPAVASLDAFDRPEDVEVVAHLDELRENRR